MINTLKVKKLGYDIDNLTEFDWEYISECQKLSESFIEKYQDKVDWMSISEGQKLSEQFIDKFKDKVDWDYISIYQNLSEPFIDKYKDKVNWVWISKYQKLSESFIGRYQDKVDWVYISAYQKLSESFIEKYQDEVNWDYISKNQKLSEPFIEKFQDRVGWKNISKYQKLSENFIKKYQNKVDWEYISKYQNLSESFIKKYKHKNGFHMYLINDSWYYKSTEFKKEQVVNTGLYDCYDNYFIAYKGIRSDNYSKFNFQYQYFVGNTYECFADYSDDEDSFGLSAWTYDKAKEYCNEKIIKVKIYYKDVARVVHDGGKIRCCKFEVLEEVK